MATSDISNFKPNEFGDVSYVNRDLQSDSRGNEE